MNCPNCGSGHVTRELSGTGNAGRSSSRLIGSERMSVTRVCKDCEWSTDGV